MNCCNTTYLYQLPARCSCGYTGASSEQMLIHIYECDLLAKKLVDEYGVNEVCLRLKEGWGKDKNNIMQVNKAIDALEKHNKQ